MAITQIHSTDSFDIQVTLAGLKRLLDALAWTNPDRKMTKEALDAEAIDTLFILIAQTRYLHEFDIGERRYMLGELMRRNCSSFRFSYGRKTSADNLGCTWFFNCLLVDHNGESNFYFGFF